MRANELIKLIRQRTGLNQRRFAQLVGCEQAAISRLESGKTMPSLNMLIRILRVARAQKININMDDIIDG